MLPWSVLVVSMPPAKSSGSRGCRRRPPGRLIETPRRLREERVLHPPAGYVAGESFVLNAALPGVVQTSVYGERRCAVLDVE
jgi:hypothetical protein